MTDVADQYEKESAYVITDEDIERSQMLVGLDSPGRMQGRITTATEDSMRNFAMGYGDDSPMFCDPEYGASTRWGGQVAPPMSLIAHFSPLLGDPIDPELKARTRGRFRGIHVFISGGDWTWYRPILAGDRIYSFGGIEKVEVKSSEFAGRSVLVTERNVKMNQHGDVVAVQRHLLIHAERKTAKSKGKYSAIEPATYTDDDLAAIDAVYSQERPRGAEPRWWEDVQVGDTVGPLIKGPLTVTDVICFHHGGYGYAEYGVSPLRLGYKNRMRVPAFYIKNDQGIPDVSQRVHWQNDWAQAIGNPMAYDYAVMRECWAQHLLTDWMGDDGFLFRQHEEMRKFNYLGDTQTLVGTVMAKHLVDGVGAVDIDFTATSQRGDLTMPGNATVLLPSRDHGPVRLPRVEPEIAARAAAMIQRHGELMRAKRTG